MKPTIDELAHNLYLALCELLYTDTPEGKKLARIEALRAVEAWEDK